MLIVDNLIVDAPDFKEPWERAFDNWKNYVAKKEEKGNVMKAFEDTAKGAKIKKRDQEANKDEKPKEEKPKDEAKPTVSEDTKTETSDIKSQPAAPV